MNASLPQSSFATLPWRTEFMIWADSTVDQTVYYIRNEDLDPRKIESFAGCIGLANVAFEGDGLFAFASLGGEPAAVIEVIDYNGFNDPVTVDLVAWSIHDPECFATALGAASALGGWNVTNIATVHAGNLLKIHRTPLAWLKAGCVGVCILDHALTSAVLGRAVGPILAEDEDHARELRRACLGLSQKPRMAFPTPSRQSKAA